MVTTHTLTIDGERFALPDVRELARIRGRLAAAVRRGGAFVRMPGSRQHPIELLVTSHSHIRIESNEAMDDLDSASVGAGAGMLSTIIDPDWDF